MHGTITLQLDSEAHLRAAMAIQRLIRIRMATRRLRTRISQSMFTKKLDMQHGKWYYVMKRTGETTWDVPRGEIPMALPPDTKMQALAKEKMEKALTKRKESERRRFLIEQRKEEFRQSQIKDKNKAEEAERDRRDQLWADAVVCQPETD